MSVNSESDYGFTLSHVVEASKKYRSFAIFLIILCVLLEIWFLKYPPRGMITTDVIVLGTVKGQPLVSFEQIWKRFVFDDNFLLETAEKSGFFTNQSPEEKLALLGKIRKSLSFEIEKDYFVKISFRQPGAKKVRTFLNSFTESLVKKLELIISEEFDQKKESAEKNLLQLENRAKFLKQAFNINFDENIIGKIVKNSFLTICGDFLENELTIPLHNAKKNLLIYTYDKWNFLSLYPRKPQILTDKKTQPQPIQPFYVLFLMLIPVGIFFMYAGVMVIISQQRIGICKD